MIKVASIFCLLVLIGCADTIGIADPSSLSFATARESARATLNARIIPIQQGQTFPLLITSDGRKIVQLDSFVSSEPLLLGASTSQTFGSLLDESLCTTGGLVSIARNQVNIETVIAGVEPRLCFSI